MNRILESRNLSLIFPSVKEKPFPYADAMTVCKVTNSLDPLKSNLFQRHFAAQDRNRDHRRRVSLGFGADHEKISPHSQQT